MIYDPIEAFPHTPVYLFVNADGGQDGMMLNWNGRVFLLCILFIFIFTLAMCCRDC